MRFQASSLPDPTVLALSGVSAQKLPELSEKEKRQLWMMVEAGDVLNAQKFVLARLDNRTEALVPEVPLDGIERIRKWLSRS